MAEAGGARGARPIGRRARSSTGPGELPLLLTCEHAGLAVPARWRPLFAGRERLLASHRGLDSGARELARELGRLLGAPPRVHDATRLLVDTNRSLGNRGLFSELTRALPGEERARLVETLWRPHRERVTARLREALRRWPRVCHVGVHSFTPVRRGRRRALHVGLLYDPARTHERALAARWRAELARLAPALIVRRNAPYRGTSDGLTTALRVELGPRYLGLELEVRRDRLARAAERSSLAAALGGSLRAALRDL